MCASRQIHPVVSFACMTAHSGPRKRRNPGQHPPSSDDSQRPAKRQRVGHPAQRPPEFWDKLTQIYLERSALEEWNRRNAESHPETSCSTHLRRRPVTRGFIASIRPLAEAGGPDLSDLRGVCRRQLLLTHANPRSVQESRYRTRAQHELQPV